MALRGPRFMDLEKVRRLAIERGFHLLAVHTRPGGRSDRSQPQEYLVAISDEGRIAGVITQTRRYASKWYAPAVFGIDEYAPWCPLDRWLIDAGCALASVQSIGQGQFKPGVSAPSPSQSGNGE